MLARMRQEACVSMSHIRTLQSWKEIAGYIGRGVRTVQRWESLGLPVRRPQVSARKSAVYAISHELDTWLLNNPEGRGRPGISSFVPSHVAQKNSNGLKQILITHELFNRPARKRDRAAPIAALKAVAKEVTSPANRLFSIVVNHALELCAAGSAGLSVLHKEDREAYFHWDVMAGLLRECVGQTTPRNFSPCGVTLARRSPQLFSYPAKYFQYLKDAPLPLVEGLVIPIFVNDRAWGTVWIVSHDESCQFDSEDVFVMTSLAAFCETALSYMAGLFSFSTQSGDKRDNHVLSLQGKGFSLAS